MRPCYPLPSLPVVVFKQHIKQQNNTGKLRSKQKTCGFAGQKF
jgi:hypothetical protein